MILCYASNCVYGLMWLVFWSSLGVIKRAFFVGQFLVSIFRHGQWLSSHVVRGRSYLNQFSVRARSGLSIVLVFLKIMERKIYTFLRFRIVIFVVGQTEKRRLKCNTRSRLRKQAKKYFFFFCSKLFLTAS